MDSFKSSKKITVCICFDQAKFVDVRSASNVEEAKRKKLIDSLNTFVKTLKDANEGNIEFSNMRMDSTEPKLADLSTDKNSNKEVHFKDSLELVSFPELETHAQPGDIGLCILKSIEELDRRKVFYNNQGIPSSSILVVITDGKKQANSQFTSKAIKSALRHEAYNDFVLIPVLVADSRLSKFNERVIELAEYKLDNKIANVVSAEDDSFKQFLIDLANTLVEYKQTFNHSIFAKLQTCSIGKNENKDGIKMALDGEFKVVEQKKVEKKKVVKQEAVEKVNKRTDFVKDYKSISPEYIDGLIDNYLKEE